MLVKTNDLIVTSFDESDLYMENMINSVKLDFGKLNTHGRETTSERVYRCKNKDCWAVFSANDAVDLIGSKEYLQNQKLFGEKAKLTADDFVGGKNKVWICRFCGEFQAVSEDSCVVLGSSVKFAIDEKENPKVNNEPIILFLIDSSSSMEEVICEINQDKMSKDLIELMNNSQLVNKNKERERESLQRIMKRNNVHQNIQANNFISKKNLMLAILTKVLKSLRMKVKSEKDEDRKIGFLFFNQNIFLVNDGLTKDYSIIHSSNYYVNESFDINQSLGTKPKQSQFKSADYFNSQELFRMGAEHGNQYKTKISNLDIEKMDFPGVPSDGKTALGPALAVALGIVSKHGEGSSVVVVTDGIANVGILEAEAEYPQAERFVLQQLKYLKCMVGVLQWVDINSHHSGFQKAPQLNYFNRFVDKNTKMLQRYEINVSINMEAVDMHMAALQNLAFRKIIAVIKNFKILCSADFITFEKTKFQQSMLEDGELISNNKSFFLNIKLNKSAIKEQEYLQPVVTQCIIEYMDVKYKRVMCFASQLKQTLSKSYRKIVSLVNFQNIQEYFDNEDLHNYSERCTINGRERSIRETFNSVYGSMSSKRARINDIHDPHEATYRSIGRARI